MKKSFAILTLSLLIIGVSCTSKSSQNDIFHYTVKRNCLEHRSEISGIIEPVNKLTVSVESIWTDATIKYLIPEGTSVKKGDTVCILEASEIENKYQEAKDALKTAQAEYNKTLAEIRLKEELLNAQILTLKSTTAINKLDSAQLAFASPIRKQLIELNMDKANIMMKKLESSLQFSKIINQSTLESQRLKIVKSKSDLKRAAWQVSKLYLKAHSNGMAIYEKHWQTGYKVKVGDIVWNRFPIVKIPTDSKIHILCKVPESEYKILKKGQNASISLDAKPGIKMYGEINRIPPMGKPIEKDSKIKVYEVIVSIDSSDYKPEMGLSATCDIMVKIIQDTLTVPLVALYEWDESKIVYKLEGKKYQRQKVTLGKRGNNDIIVTQGVNENDIIALSEPPEYLIINEE